MLTTTVVFFFVGALKGVMRVGVLAKGLLLHERLDVDLVVLCHGERTVTSWFKSVMLKFGFTNINSELM